MIELSRINAQAMSVDPFRWAVIESLFSQHDAKALARSFPRDHFKTVTGYDSEKGWVYEARSLISMGATVATNSDFLSEPWRRLADDLMSPDYRAAMSQLTGLALLDLPIEVNVFHYGPSAWLGPHVDLPNKLVTHVLYFNEDWDADEGGCLTVLRSSKLSDVVATVLPIVGNSFVLVRSDHSWHAVTPVNSHCRTSRRSMTVTFYSPGSISTMWPPGDVTALHSYAGDHRALAMD